MMTGKFILARSRIISGQSKLLDKYLLKQGTMNQKWRYICPKHRASDISRGSRSREIQVNPCMKSSKICYKSYQIHVDTTYLTRNT